MDNLYFILPQKKLLQKLFFVFIVQITFYSCGNGNFKTLPDITGRSGDLLVVMDTAFKSLQTGEAVMETFSSEQFGLPQREPIFNVVIIPQKAFTSILKSSRNIVAINIVPQHKPSFSIQKEIWAKGQVVMNIFAPNDIIASKILRKNKNQIIAYLQRTEIERLQQKYSKITNKKQIEKIEKLAGINIKLPIGFIPMIEKENYLSFRQDKRVGEHTITQCISIWHYPFLSDSTFSISKLISVRDSVTKLYQQSSAKNAYMEVYKELMPTKHEINLNKNYAVELRGLWSMVNDFMGGPFINYTFVDEKNARVICIDGYVYAPQFDKREYLRELEAIGRSATLILK